MKRRSRRSWAKRLEQEFLDFGVVVVVAACCLYIVCSTAGT